MKRAVNESSDLQKKKKKLREISFQRFWKSSIK